MTAPFEDLLLRTRKGEAYTLVDLSRRLSLGEAAFPGDPPFLVLPWHTLAIHGFATRVLFLSEHAGTHVDVPAHFFASGASVASIPPERFFGRARALDASSLPRPFTQEDLRTCGVEEGDIVLFPENPCLQKVEAEALLACGIKGVGIETASIDEPPFPLHRLFLEKGVLIYENLVNVKKLLEKEALFFGFPLKIPQGTASPVRAVALIVS